MAPQASPPVRVRGFDHLVLRVADVERSLSFYVDSLGCLPERVDAWRAGQVPFPSVRLSATALIDLVPRRGAATESGRNLDHLCLEVDDEDLDGAVARLRAQGVVVDGEATTRWGARGDGRSAYVRDPDGNVVELKVYPR